MNLGLFINLLRVIVVKLMLRTKSNHSHYTSHFVKRGVKTSLVLLPIFGLQYAIEGVPVDPTETCSSFALFILYLQTIVEGLQGIIVTTALCFLNKEVGELRLGELHCSLLRRTRCFVFISHSCSLHSFSLFLTI